MKKLENWLILIFLIFYFSNASAIGNLCKEILNFWFMELVPSLFLSIFLIQILSKTSFFTKIGTFFYFLCPVLNLNEEALGFVFSCLFIGAPSSAALIGQAYHNERITQSMAQRLLYSTPVCTISFLLMSAGAQMLHSQKAGLFLWLIQLTASFFLLWSTRSTAVMMTPELHQKKHSAASALFQTGSIVFLIGGYLLMFQTLAYLFNLFLPSQMDALIRILSEFSYGCLQISQKFTFEYAFVLISALCGFNGFCVHFQTVSICEMTICYPKYLLYRILQAVLSALFALAVLPLLHG